jgi:DNA-binding LacI/PurR family transcriptional regulator
LKLEKRKQDDYRKRVTSVEVARLAGVSQATVSRTFADSSKVSEHTKKSIFVAAEKLGYSPNAIARGLIMKSTKMIGIVMHHFMNPFYSYLLQQFTSGFQQRGFVTLLIAIEEEYNAKDALPIVLQYYVDGLVFISATLSSTLEEQCKASGTPVVLFNRYTSEGSYNSVRTDNISGGHEIGDFLVKSNYRRIAIVEGTESSSNNKDRRGGFLASLKEHGHEVFQVERGDYSYDSGYQAGKRMLRGNNLPDAVFCANDLMALGLMDVARSECDLNIPSELAVIGFDDIPQASWNGYQLTTYRQPVEKLIGETIEVLINAISDPEVPLQTKIIKGDLLIRASTGK